MALVWQLESQPRGQDISVLSDGVLSYGRALAHDGNAQPLACVVHDGETLVAGGSGRTEYDRLFIGLLWVAEQYRRQRIATRILNEMERAAVERGCKDAIIETLDDAVAVMYTRLGYEPLAMIPRYVGRFNKSILLKPVLAPLRQ